MNPRANKKTTPNYQQLNYASLKQRQHDNKRQREEVKPAPAPFKLKRFTKVESVVHKSPSEAKFRRDNKPFSLPQSVTEDSSKNYVLSNAVAAINAEPRRSPLFVRPNARSLNPSYGRVPKYLKNIQSELESHREALAKKAEAAKVPYGMRLIPEDERVQTLEALQRKKGEVFIALNKLPIGSTTPSLVRRKNDYEKQLTELESAIATFSRRHT
jgi:hypothetical protein